MAPLPSETLHEQPDRRFASLAPETPASDATLSDVLTTLRKRKWIIIAAALLGIAYGLYQAYTQVKLYTASGRIEIRNGSANQFRVSAGPSVNDSGYRLPSELTILKSDTLLLKVARDLDLPNDPDFTGRTKDGKPRPRVDIDDPNVRLSMIAAMQGAVDVGGISKTDIVQISAKSSSPRLSAQIVNQLVQDYILRSFEARRDSTNRASRFLGDQLNELKKQVEDSQSQMIDMGKRLNIIGLDTEHMQISSAVEGLTTAAGAAEVQRILAQSRYRVLSGMDPGSVDQSIAVQGGVFNGTSELGALRGQLENLKATFARLNTAEGPNNPDARALRNQLAELQKQVDEEQNRLLTQAKENFVAAQANEDQTRAALEAEKNEAYKMRDDVVNYTIAQREFESNRKLYEDLLDRLRSAGVQAGLESTEIDIVDPALPPAGPSLRPKSSILIVNTMIALVLGVILAYILDALDTGLSSVAEIEQISGLPSLALIPRSRRTGVDLSQLSVAQRNVAVLSSPKSQFAEAFRALRTSLLLSTAGKQPKVLLMTSGTPSEGKTTASLNLACVLAQGDARVLLIDADLRRPTVHHRFGLNGKLGLTSILTGSTTLEGAIQKIAEVPNLDILVSGPVPPFPTEMLSSSSMLQLLEHCRDVYTHIVIDSPPLLSVTDGVVLARNADAVVVVVRHGKSTKQALRRTRDLLARAGAPATGIALNAVDLNSPEYYGYYGYYGYTGYASAGVDASGWESQAKSGNPGKNGKSDKNGTPGNGGPQ